MSTNSGPPTLASNLRVARVVGIPSGGEITVSFSDDDANLVTIPRAGSYYSPAVNDAVLVLAQAGRMYAVAAMVPSGVQIPGEGFTIGTGTGGGGGGGVGGTTAYYQNDAPSGANVGDLWYDSNDGNKQYYWDGSAWILVQDAAIATAQATADNAQATADAAGTDAATAFSVASGKTTTFYDSNPPTTVGRVVGDTWFDTANGFRVYRWNGSAWVASAFGSGAIEDGAITAAKAAFDARSIGGVTTFVSGTQPPSPLNGDLWVNTAASNELLRFNGTSWVSVRDATIAAAAAIATAAQTTADGKNKVYSQASAPVSGLVVGDIWYDSDDGFKPYRWNGTSWSSVQDGSITTALSNSNDALAAATTAQNTANNSQLTADGKNRTYYQAAAPSGTLVAGDLWFDTDDGYKPYRWSGSAWNLVQDGSIATAQSTANTAQTTASTKTVTYAQITAPTGGSYVIGDLWYDTDDNNKMYRWNGSAWISMQDGTIAVAQSTATAAQTAASAAQTTADGKNRIFYQTTAPSTVGRIVGDLWFDTDDGYKPYTFNGTSWVGQSFGSSAIAADSITATQIAPGTVTTAEVNFTARSIGGITTTTSSTAPASPLVGDLWIDTGNGNLLKRWSGSAWVALQDGAIATAQTTANTAQTTAASKNKTFYQTTAPASGMVTGDLWFDTDDAYKQYRYDGATWTSVQDGMIVTATNNASTALTTANGKNKTFYQTTAPTASAVGDIWFDSDDGYKQYRWDGSAWAVVQDAAIGTALTNSTTAISTANSKNKTYYQTTAPVSGMVAGDLWFDTDDGYRPYRYSGTVWQDARDATIATAQATASSKNQTFYATAAPTASVAGDIWYDTDDNNKMYRWSGSAWVSVQDGTIVLAQNAAATAQTTANSKIQTFYQTSPPTATAVGDIWFDTDDGNKQYRWSGAAWASVQDTVATNALAIANTKNKSYYQTSVPASGMVTGDLWFDTDDGYKIYRYDGVSWLNVQDAAIGTAQTTANTANTTANTANTNASTALTTANSKNKTYYQTTAPASGMIAGDLWFDTDDAYRCYRYSGAAWQDVRDGTIATAISTANTATTTANTATTTANTALTAANSKNKTYYQISAPVSGMIDGDIWFDTDDGYKIYRYNGTSWLNVQDAQIATAISTANTAQTTATTATTAASTAQTTADGKNKTYYQTTAPASGLVIGDLWFDTDDGYKAYRWNGAAWQTAQDSAITTATSTSNTALTTANSANTAVAGKTATFYQTTAPSTSGRTSGDLWFDTDDGYKPYYWNGTAWTPAAFGSGALAADSITSTQIATGAVTTTELNAAVTARALGSIITTVSATAPVGPVTGDIWIDSSIGNVMKRWSGSAWVVVTDNAIATATSTANTASTTATNAQTAVASKTSTFYQTSQPSTSGRVAGDLWFDTDDGNKPYYWNGAAWTVAMFGSGALAADSITATQIASGAVTTAELAGTVTARALGSVINTVSATAPVGPLTGDLWIDTANGNVLKRWSGSAWVTYQDTAIATATSTSNTALTTANSASTTANNAQTAVASKTTVYFQAAQPPTSSRVVGDTWFDTDDGYKPYYWNGTLWSATAFGSSAIGTDAITSTQIAAGAVTSTEILAGTIVASNIATGTITADRIATNTITSTQIAANTILASNIQAGTITADRIAANTITASQIAADTITAGQIAAGAITTNELAANSVTSAQIVAGTIVASDIAAGTITSNEIAANTITAGDIAANTITAGQIAAGTITAAQIAAGTITSTQIMAGTIVAGNIAAGTITSNEIAANTITANKLSVVMGGGNLAYNSSFEVDSDANGIPDGWNAHTIGAPTGATRTLPGTNVVSGAKALQLFATSLPTASEQVGVYQDVYLPVGAQLPLIVSVYATLAGTGAGYGAKVEIYNSSSALIDQFTSPVLNASGRLVLKSPANLGSTAFRARVYIYLQSSAGAVSNVSATLDALQVETGDIVSAWMPRPDEILPGTIAGSMIQAGAITVGSAIIQDAAITNLKIANDLSANKITTGTLDAARIAANSITANKLSVLVGGGNTLPNSSFPLDVAGYAAVGAGGAVMHWSTDGGYYGTTGMRVDYPSTTTTPGAACSTRQQSVEGAIYTASMWVRLPAGQVAGNYRAQIDWWSAASGGSSGGTTYGTTTAVPVGTQWVRLLVTSTCPSGFPFAAISFTRISNAVTGYTVTDAWQYEPGDLPTAYSPKSDEILPGTIVTNMIAANQITAAQMVTGTITAGSGIIADAAITTAKIADAQISTAKIIDAAITNAKVQSLDAAKITTGFLDAARINANTITAEKLTLSGVRSGLIRNGSFEDINVSNLPISWVLQTSGDCAGATYASSTTTKLYGTRSLQMNVPIGSASRARATSEDFYPCDPNSIMYGKFSAVCADAGGAVINVTLDFYDSNLVFLSSGWLWDGKSAIPNTWLDGQESMVSLPANARFFKIVVTLLGNATIAKTVYLDDITVKETFTAAQIASIDAGTITVGTMNAERIGAGTLSAGITLTGSISAGTLPSGARVVMNSAGIEAFNSSNQLTFDVDASTGNVSILGALKTAAAGARIEIDTTNANYIKFFSGSVYEDGYQPWGYIRSGVDTTWIAKGATYVRGEIVMSPPRLNDYVNEHPELALIGRTAVDGISSQLWLKACGSVLFESLEGLIIQHDLDAMVNGGLVVSNGGAAGGSITLAGNTVQSNDNMHLISSNGGGMFHLRGTLRDTPHAEDALFAKEWVFSTAGGINQVASATIAWGATIDNVDPWITTGVHSVAGAPIATFSTSRTTTGVTLRAQNITAGGVSNGRVYLLAHT